VEDKTSKKSFPTNRKIGVRLFQECAKRGLVSRIKDDTFMLAPAFVISDSDIDLCVNIVGESIPAACSS
jgi:adenosylmethionine-8-amino-7-oxononanoate aminotransferase